MLPVPTVELAAYICGPAQRKLDSEKPARDDSYSSSRYINTMHNNIYTIGHSTLGLETFIGLLQEQRVDTLVDVRAFPGSRRYPHFNKENLLTAMPAAGIRYEHLLALGGRRKKSTGEVPSRNTFWQHVAFRNYADYALGDEFREGLLQLEQIARENTCAIMCSEAVWWRCHRRIIADYLLADNIPVFHILGKGKVEPAHMTAGARRAGPRQLIYDQQPGGQKELFT
jgi:uncharacterized protein (DUF488 family)